MSFDYVIVGGGTCGLVLANRLSEDPNITVAVIEPGEDTRNNPNVTDPDNFIVPFDTSIDWSYPSTPQHGAANRSLIFHSGRAIGGTSTINGMTYIRADAAQIDAWEALGNEGWNWAALLPYYKRTERFAAPTKAQEEAGASFRPEYHGGHGDVHVGFRYALPNGSLHGLVRETWGRAGYAANPDVNGGETRGFDVWPMTVDPESDLRWDAARAYYYPVEDRGNLALLRGTGLSLEWGTEPTGHVKATGVRYVDGNNQTVTVGVGREVVLSAGALRTPLLLEMSGIGNPRILRDIGLDAVVSLPGVGENLQEQPNSNLIFEGTLDVTGYATYATFGSAEDLFGAERAAAVSDDVGAKLRAYAAHAASGSRGGLDESALEHIFRVQHDLMFSKNVTLGETITAASPSSGYLVTAWWCLMPFSRGRVHLASPGAFGSPLIDPQYFAADIDMATQVAIGKQAQSFWHTDPIAQVAARNLTADPASDEEWAEYITHTFEPNNHPIGTASMMARDLGGVVSPEFRVYGTGNVRVVDASVIPLQISGHLTATLYAIAERAAEMIKASVLAA